MRPRGRLSIPTALTVSVVAAIGLAPGCSDDKTGTETEVSASGATRGDDTGSTTAPTTTTPTTTAPTTTASTGDTSMTDATSGTDTGGVPECPLLADKASCNAQDGCIWRPEFPGCYADCAAIDDEATCVMYGMCGWFDDQCQLVLE